MVKKTFRFNKTFSKPMLRLIFGHANIVANSILFLFLQHTSLAAQSKGDGSNTNIRRWTVSVLAGFATSGPSTDIERLLTSGLFNETDSHPASSQPGKDHPYSLTGLDFQNGAPWMVSSYYLLKNPVSLGIIFSNVPLGVTWGFRKPISLSIDYSVSTVAPILAFQFADILRLGGGPAVHKPKTNATGFGTKDNGTFESKLGFLLDFSLTLPSRSNFFGELKVQYRSVGSATIGPFETSSLSFSETLPATEVNYSHWFIGIGFGIGTWKSVPQ